MGKFLFAVVPFSRTPFFGMDLTFRLGDHPRKAAAGLPFENVNDAKRLAYDPTFRLIG